MGKLNPGDRGYVSWQTQAKWSGDMATITTVHRTWAQFVTDAGRTLGWVRIAADRHNPAWFGVSRPTASEVAFGSRAYFRTDHEAARAEAIWRDLADVRTVFLPPSHLTLEQVEQIRVMLRGTP